MLGRGCLSVHGSGHGVARGAAGDRQQRLSKANICIAIDICIVPSVPAPIIDSAGERWGGVQLCTATVNDGSRH